MLLLSEAAFVFGHFPAGKLIPRRLPFVSKRFGTTDDPQRDRENRPTNIYECLRKFGEYARPGISPEEYAEEIESQLRPDVRRVSLLISLAKSVIGDEFGGEGLMGLRVSVVSHGEVKFQGALDGHRAPRPQLLHSPDYQQAFRDYTCSLMGLDFVHEPLPFADQYFSVITFSETLEHLPVERLNFVLGEIGRVLRPGGILIASSPNQAGLENRLLKGGSVFDLPDQMEIARGIFKHIRLYTPAEVTHLMSRLGFRVECSAMESNNSTYRGKSPKSMYRRMYRLYQGVEQRLGFLRSLTDTWYFVFRKAALDQPVKGGNA